MVLGFVYMRVVAEGYIAERMRGRGRFCYIVRLGKRVMCRVVGWRCEEIFGNGLR